MSPKRKTKRPVVKNDFTINDYANAVNPIERPKKSNNTLFIKEDVQESWEDVDNTELDVEEIKNIDGTQIISIKKKSLKIKSGNNLDNCPGHMYPEIIWFYISQFIQPEDIGTFSCINRSCYLLTKRESFWIRIYNQYCKDSIKLPSRLKIENGFRVYGLKNRVVRSLYHTYDVFVLRAVKWLENDHIRPNSLIRRRCVNIWYCKLIDRWVYYFKFKRNISFNNYKTTNLLTVLDDIDANSEENSQVLRIICNSFYVVPPLMGLTLCSAMINLSQGFRTQKLHLGFTSSPYLDPSKVIPDIVITIDDIVSFAIYDWWHPQYPHFDNLLPNRVTYDEEDGKLLLEEDFISLAVV